MRLWLFILLMLAAPVFAETCPAVPDISAEKARLLAALRSAPDPETAQSLTNEMWTLWTKAPDANAQELLDNGMERRDAYDFDRGRAVLTELVTYCPDYAEGWNQRAFVQFLAGDYALALEDLEVAVRLSPDHFAALAGQAVTLMNLGRMEAGQTVLRKALEFNPWLPERGLLITDPKGKEL